MKGHWTWAWPHKESGIVFHFMCGGVVVKSTYRSGYQQGDAETLCAYLNSRP